MENTGRQGSATNNTGSPALHDGRLFVPISSMEVVSAQNPEYECCTSSGAVAALNASTGEELWYHRVIPDTAVAVGQKPSGTPLFAPSGAPVWSSPTVDVSRGLVYVGTGENYTRPTTSSSDAILALEIATGRLAWSFQGTEADAFRAAVIVDVNPDRELSPGLYAIDLMTGTVVWSVPAPTKTCGGRAGCFAANSAAPTVIQGAVFAGGLDGHIRAHSTNDGRLLWDFDTAREFETVNGVTGHGGAIDGPGPVISGGLVFVNSGYGSFGQMSGNLLLAFGVAGN